MINSRLESWEILKKVFTNKAFSNVLLNEVSNKTIDEKFKNLIFAIVHGTITYKIYLDYLTSKLIDNRKTPLEIQILLWMSLYQIRFLEAIPSYAIVNEAVQIARKINPKFTGLVNACLQKVLRDKDKFFEVKINHSDRKLCVENGYPWFLFEKISQSYGTDIARKLCLDSTQRPPISVRVNTLLCTTEKLLAAYQFEFGLQLSSVKNCLIADRAIVKSELYSSGKITIQDPASILVGETLQPTLNSKVLDMCSAPGGKLTHLAAIMNNTGKLIAYELNENKIKLIKQNIDRLNVQNVELHVGDSRLINYNETFDYVLLDAPCSGFGVLKRKPEIKFNNVDQKSLSEIVKLQAELLTTAYVSLKVGGEMVYSTCTINADENFMQIKKFVNKYPEMKIIFEKQIFGYEDNTDGFYICKLIKESKKV
ncbi:16S rRNA (cytosine(967)-C(5))-methyltransferase RsmB [Mesoplasma syrphidae]|uniref:16S rRNA (cytosine(967)-C(5))-methyltransferase n=1 Tax=Mesoplasma syrphidae TaxID=225999 RepID=A0A2K9BYE2_9MOLU|nr:16S rRNA (cytosine(967)-C(5))-methyltransferase RsmB [Mesoplasma syrphidae]AUF83388.1 16S rRNA (cytosine(967)-C(5))-methyltransferase RsmB [Mesoplasma syrphidae]